MNKTKHFLYFWLPLFTWAIIIFTFSANPANPVSEIYWRDFIVKKTAHIVEYAIFTILLYRALMASGVKKKNAAVYSVITGIIYGFTDEFHQSFTPGREPKLRDVIFDTIGSLFAIVFLLRLLPIMPVQLRKWAEKIQLI